MSDPFARAFAAGDYATALARANTATRRAVAFERLGRMDDAESAARGVLAAAPDDRVATLILGAVLERQGRRVDAIAAYRALAEAHPDWLAPTALLRGAGGAGFEAPLQGEVRELFDRYAGHFDTHLLETLGYDGHRVAAAALMASGPPQGIALDLGCGTGLSGEALRGVAERFIGIDVSAGMLAEAAKRGIYDALVQADLTYALATQPTGTVAWMVAADALGYLGELGAVFEEAARALVPGGVWAFTVEATARGRWELGPARRARYHERYLVELAGRHDLEVVAMSEAALRREADGAVPAYVVTLRRPVEPGEDV